MVRPTNFAKRLDCGAFTAALSEARVYPVVNFEAKRSSYLDRLRTDRELQHLAFEKVRTDFEFLLNSNFYLRVSHR